MGRFAKTLLALCAVVGMPAVQAAAAHENRSANTETNALASTSKAAEDKRAPQQRVNGEGHYLRCWQYGRLLFEEPVAAIPPELAAQGWSFRGKGEQKGAMHLLDTHSGTTCLLK